MITKRRRMLNTIIVCTLLLSQLIPVAAAVTTEESSSAPKSETESTTSTEKNLQSTTSSSFTMQQETKPEISENEVEKNYEERALEETTTSRDHPTVTIEEKKIEDEQLKLKGKINTPKTATNQSIIKKMVLQSKVSDGTWSDKKKIELKDVEVQKKEMDFNFDENVTEEKDFRLIFDYEISSFSNEVLTEKNLHKAHFLVEHVELIKKSDNSDEKVCDKNDYDSDEKKVSGSIRPQVNSYQNSKRSQRSVANSVWGDESAANKSLNGTYEVGKSFAMFHDIKGRSSKLNYHSSSSLVSGLGDDHDFYFVWSTDSSYRVSGATNENSVKADKVFTGTSSPSAKYYGFKNVTITKLLPNKTYYVWICRAGSTGTLMKCSSISNFDRNPDMNFTTDGPVALNTITTPVISDNTKSTVKINKSSWGTYKGDPNQSGMSGKIKLKKVNDTSYSNKVTSYVHEVSENGKYGVSGGTVINNLLAGTKYKTRVSLRNYEDTKEIESNEVNFSTINDPKVPDEPTKNTPTASDPKATAEFTAKYGASKGGDGDHPSATQIEIQVTDERENLLTTLKSNNYTSGTGIRLSANPTVTNNVDTPYIKFKLVGLSSRTTYKVRYKVTNSIGTSAYSDYKQFTTNAIALSITAPKFTQASATTSSIPMTGQSYTGDICQTNNQGKVQVTSNEGANIVDKVTNLAHTKTTNGTYSSSIVSNLAAGTKYKGRVAIKDNGGVTWKYSGWSYFYTPNTVNRPSEPTLNTPTTSENAIAELSATYNVGDVAAHPSSVEVQYSLDNSNWKTINSTTTPATTTPTITENENNVSFKLSKLKSKTNYFVRYRVKNSSTVWSSYSSSRDFTTNGVPLEVRRPTFDQESATPNSIMMEKGTYIGDIAEEKGDIEIDGTAGPSRVNNVLQHDTYTGTENTPGEYGTNAGGYKVSNLTPGSKNYAWVYFKNAENVETSGIRVDFPFIIPNRLDALEITGLTHGATLYSGEASFKVPYEANALVPKKIKVEVNQQNGENIWTEVTENADLCNPKLSMFQGGSIASKEMTFTVSQLKPMTTYKIRVQSQNKETVDSIDGVSRKDVSVWSNVVESEFTTQNLPDGYYLDNVPNFNFGTIDASDQEISTGLSRNNGTSSFNMDILNVGMSAWGLSAEMTEMTTDEEDSPVQILNGARIEFTKKLEKRSDENNNWTPVTSGFSGLEGTPNNQVSLTAGSGAINLFSAEQGNNLGSQGEFRNVIDFESVKLIVPPNVGDDGKTYAGKINWKLDSLP